MDLKIIGTVFTTIFIAELGDKTQIATMLFAADKGVSKLGILIGASLALILTSALGVFAGNVLSEYIDRRYLSIIAGTCFIAIGIWYVIKA